MRHALQGLCTLLFVGSLGHAALAQDKQSFDQIDRGRYLAITGDCVACHTAPGGAPFAGGLALETPFGTILSPNITPDRETGIGAWSDAQFLAAVRDGFGHRGEHLYPAMPYPYYSKVTRDDVLAMRAYLATIEPVKNRVVANQLPFPFNMRFVLTFWNWLNFSPGTYQADPLQSAEWNRGAYLVQGLTHCGACHTAKNFLGGDKSSAALQGGVLQNWYAPDITADAHEGLGNWTEDDIVGYLKSGANRWTLATGPMAEEIVNSSSHMSDEDLKAIAVYLASLKPAAKTAPQPLDPNDKLMVAGGAIYKDNCSACHTDAGAGSMPLFPRLAGASLVQASDPTTLIRVVLEGSRAVSTAQAPTGPAMPAFGWRLDDKQIAALLTYMRNAWGNAASPVTASQVVRLRPPLSTNP